MPTCTKLGLSGQGVYHMNSSIRGDLVVVIRVKTATLTDEQKAVIRAWKTF